MSDVGLLKMVGTEFKETGFSEFKEISFSACHSILTDQIFIPGCVVELYPRVCPAFGITNGGNPLMCCLALPCMNFEKIIETIQ